VPTSLEEVEGPVRGGDHVRLSVNVANRGERPGKQVIQVYAERATSAVDRPVRWLVGFAAVRLQAGEDARVDVPVDTRLLAHWAEEWVYEPGDFQLLVGTSSVDLPLQTRVEVVA
jgi:beta-glucosidase